MHIIDETNFLNFMSQEGKAFNIIKSDWQCGDLCDWRCLRNDFLKRACRLKRRSLVFWVKPF